MTQRWGRSRVWLAWLFLGLLALAGSSAGCGKSGQVLGPQSNLKALDFGYAKTDTVPKPPPPHPHAPDLTAQFANADPTPADSTGTSRWVLGNNTSKALAVNWTVTGDSSWSAFPIQGSVTLNRRSTAPLAVPIPVPAGTAPGTYPLLLTVQTASGSGAASASGFISVPGDSLRVR